jgi:two-component system sensor histidine kinase BaeS
MSGNSSGQPILRISIGLRLFASVLLAIVAVAAAALVLMRHDVMQNFSDYASSVELDRLEQLSSALARQYEQHDGWAFLPRDAPARRDWITKELARLQRAPYLPPPLPAPVAPAQAASEPGLPPLPPPPPDPPPPPSLVAHPEIDELPLRARITLRDAAGHYLAGRVPGDETSASRPISVGGRTVGHLAVARVMRPSDALSAAFLGQLGRSLWGIVMASIALSALAAVLLAAHFRQPIGSLAGAARALADGRFDTRLPEDRSDELGQLARSFNQLAQRLGSVEDSRRQWVADTSHELRTPLSVLRAQLEAIEDGVRAADATTVASMLRQVLSLNQLVDQLYALARADVDALDCRRTPLDLWALALETAAAFEDKFKAAELHLETGPAPACASVLADAQQLRQVFANLFENAVRYTTSGGRVGLHAHASDTTIALVIEDSAPGVPDEALGRLSERFYRVDASRSRERGGAGLGLALCRRMLEAHEAILAFAHSPLGGLRVTITFPLELA